MKKRKNNIKLTKDKYTILKKDNTIKNNKIIDMYGCLAILFRNPSHISDKNVGINLMISMIQHPP